MTDNSPAIYRREQRPPSAKSRKDERTSVGMTVRNTISFVPDGTWYYVMDVTHRWKRWAMLFRPSGWPTAGKPKLVDWSWAGRIMPAKSGLSGKEQGIRTLAFPVK